MKRRFVAIMCLLALLTGLFSAAAEESNRVDLSSRFEEETSILCGDVRYRVRNRMTSIAVFCVTEEEMQPELIIVVVVDDARKTMQLLEIDGRIEVKVPDGDGETAMLLKEFFAMGESPREQGRAAVELMNASMPGTLVEHFFVLNVNGLTILDGRTLEDFEGDTTGERMKEHLRETVMRSDTSTSKGRLDMLEQLNDYFWTDIKSGALAKVMNKSEKYSVLPTVCLPGELDETGTVVKLDVDAAFQVMIDVFFEEDPYSVYYGK